MGFNSGFKGLKCSEPLGLYEHQSMQWSCLRSALYSDGLNSNLRPNTGYFEFCLSTYQLRKMSVLLLEKGSRTHLFSPLLFKIRNKFTFLRY